MCLVVALACSLPFLVGCSQPSRGDDTTEVVYGLTIVPSGIDPHIHASAELGIPLRSVYDTLVYRDPNTLEFVPGLAEAWTISEDALTYTFTLKQGVVFHDGTMMDADSVKVNLLRVLDPVNNSAKAAQLLGPVSDVSVIDPTHIAIILSEPFAPLLDGLSQPYLGIASPAALAGWDSLTYQFHQVGTGPYKFVEYVVNDRLVLERNPDYSWGPPLVTNTEAPAVARIIFRFYPDPASRALALQSGDAQIMGELLPTDAQALASDGTIQLLPVAVPGQPLEFLLNTTHAPTDRLAVRQALIMATDRQAIVQALFQGYSPIAYGPLSAATLYYSSDMVGRYAFDPVQAVALFNTTGLVDSDGDGWRDDGQTPIEINLVVPPWGQSPEVAQLIESQWESVLHVHVTIQQVASFPMLSDAAATENYNAISLNFFGLDPSVINAFYLSGSRLNWSHVSDTNLDQLLAEAQAEVDATRRAALYARIQNEIMDQALVLPIRDYVNLNGASPSIQGLHFDAQGWFPYLTDIGLGF